MVVPIDGKKRWKCDLKGELWLYLSSYGNIKRKLIEELNLADFFWTSMPRICTICGEVNNLVAHHIFSIFDGGYHCEENVVVLCKSCHYRFNSSEWKEMNKLIIKLTGKIGKGDPTFIEREEKLNREATKKLLPRLRRDLKDF